MMTDRIRSCENRAYLAVMETAVGKADRILRRKLSVHFCSLSDEAIEDNRTFTYFCAFGDYKILCDYACADFRLVFDAAFDCAVLEPFYTADNRGRTDFDVFDCAAV